jgi:hypothetical protein
MAIHPGSVETIDPAPNVPLSRPRTVPSNSLWLARKFNSVNYVLPGPPKATKPGASFGSLVVACKPL